MGKKWLIEAVQNLSEKDFLSLLNRCADEAITSPFPQITHDGWNVLGLAICHQLSVFF